MGYNVSMIKGLLAKIAPTILLAFFLILPEVVSAAFLENGGLVTCDGRREEVGGTPCSICHLIELGNRIISWIFGFVFVIFGVLIFVAGFGLVTSGGNQSALDAAKKKLSNAMIGLIIVMAAWLIVDTLAKAAIDGTDGNVGDALDVDRLGPWNTIECTVAEESTPSGSSGMSLDEILSAPLLETYTGDRTGSDYGDFISRCLSNGGSTITPGGATGPVECRVLGE